MRARSARASFHCGVDDGLPATLTKRGASWYHACDGEGNLALSKGSSSIMPYSIGVTGNIACGKTVVGQMLLELGVERYIDADALVHQLYEPGQPIAQKVAELFGRDAMLPDGGVDRKALGAIVFHDVTAMRRLERVVHPAVHQAMEHALSTVSEKGIVVIDAVKLLEGGSGKFCQSKWLIVCPLEQEAARLRERNHLSEEEVQARLRAQPSVAERLPLVDEVIDNGGTLAETRRQVVAAFARFCRQFVQ